MRRVSVLLFFATISCAGLSGSSVWMTKAQLFADNDANNREPIRMNIVLVYDKELAQEIGQKTATEYFKTMETLRPKKNVKIFEKNLIPGRTKGETLTIAQRDLLGVKAGYVFALYPSSQKPQRQEIPPVAKAKITFHQDDFTIEEVKG